MKIQSIMAAALLVIFSCDCVLGQVQPVVVISNPVAGQHVNAGETLPVQVQVSGITTPGVMLVGTLPQDDIPPCFSVTCTFQVTLPSTLAAGDYTIGAIAGDGRNDGLRSPFVHVQVEPAAGNSQELRVAPKSLLLPYPGAEMPLNVEIASSTGIQDIVSSTDTQIVALTPGVVSIKPNGLVHALSKGSTNVIVSFRGLQSIIAVAVGGTVRGDLNNDGVVDLDDLNILNGHLNSPAARGDARDLNGDGKIDALDARILTTFCTRPRCAVQ